MGMVGPDFPPSGFLVLPSSEGVAVLAFHVEKGRTCSV